MTENFKNAQLPTGLLDENEIPITVPVVFVTPDRKLNNYAFELTKPFESRGESVALYEAAMNQIRVCLRKIDGKSVTYADLQGKQLHRHLNPKQLELMLKAFERMNTASAGDVEFCYRSVRASYSSKGKHSRRAKLPNGQYKGDEPITRDIEFEVPTRTIINRAAEMARQFEGRSALMVSSESELNVVRLSLTKIDGRELELDNLRGDGIDDILSQKEQSCLVQVMQRLMMPDQSETEDFLSTVADGLTPPEKDKKSTEKTTTSSKDGSTTSFDKLT